MAAKQVFRSVTAAAAAVLAISGLLAAPDAAATSQAISNNVPGLVKVATNVGVTDTTQTIDVVLWLKIRNQAGLDALVADLYNPSSGSYHKWLTPSAFAATYAPTAQNATTVEQFFTSNGLSIVAVGPKNMYVRARGTVAQVNKAFTVQLNNFQLQGQTYFANATAPSAASAVVALTAAVSGLNNLQYAHPYVTQSPTKSGAQSPVAPQTPPAISADCFSGPETLSFNNGGTFPLVTLTGNGYAATAGPGGCGYTPPEIQTAYHLTELYNEGFDGTGQTIVIIDWCGSPTIRGDANTFSSAYGLPALTASNFKIINSSTPPTCGATDPEINIDVEWAHAIAPGANIDLVVPPSASFADVDTAEYFAIINGLGSVISGSYGSEEIYDAPAELQTESLINEIAAVQGISANFSTGDYGDFTFDEPQFLPASVSAPADSPYATGVGGVSLALHTNNTIAWQTGWGTNINPIRSSGFVSDPPTDGFFNFGSGGGPSAVFAKPAYQASLKGTQRLLPDISWLADPFTGGVIVISEGFQYPRQIYTVYGGTSLACPMFSALWAIANQEAGALLGQASQYVYSMPDYAVTDVLPIGSPTDVTATYKESATVTDTYSAAQLAAPLENTTKFYSGLWAYPLTQDTTYVVTFGTDSGLTTTKGWDDVTGVGTPNGQAFADYFKP
jgi:subtilase family serine protease